MILAAWFHNVLAALFVFLAVFLMIVILLQRGKGVGLSGAFGGAGGQTAFGSKTGDVLTWATVVIATLFLIAAVVLNYVFVPLTSSLGTSPPAPVVAASPEDGVPTPIALPDAAGGADETPAEAAPESSDTPSPAAEDDAGDEPRPDENP